MFELSITDWKTSHKQIKPIREKVFIEEQKVPVQLEWDKDDETAYHLLAVTSKGEAVATARVILQNKTARIGRMAVLPQWRNQGIGYNLLKTAITFCRQQHIEELKLNAQEYVIPFYEKAGFKVTSEKFLEAGIAHKSMHILLEEASS